MKHATHPFRVALLTVVLWGQAQVVQATSSQTPRLDGTVGIKGISSERQKNLAAPTVADGATPHFKQAATPFSNGASQLRQQVIEQRKAGRTGP